jgi:ribosomal protein L29
MREDAELVSIKYEKKLNDLEESEKQISESLDARVKELESEARNIKAVLFDAKLQFRSNELKEETYQQIKAQTEELIEHINNEKTEIANVRTKLASQTIENIAAATATPMTVAPAEQTSIENNQAEQVAPPVQVTASGDGPTAVPADGGTEQVAPETSWLNQVITK